MKKASEECIDKCSNLLGWKKIAEVEIILSSSSFHVVPCNFIEFPNILKGWKYISSRAWNEDSVLSHLKHIMLNRCWPHCNVLLVS